MKTRNKATLMLGVLAAAAAMNFALALPAITYAIENDSSGNDSAQTSSVDSFRKAFDKENAKVSDSLAKEVDSDGKAKKPFKDTVVDVVVELDSAAAIKHIKHRPDGTRKRLQEIDSVSDSVIGSQESLKKKVKKITGDSLDSSEDKSFGYLVNAFTTKAKLSELEEISELPGVKSVGRVNTYTTQDASANSLDSVQDAWNGISVPGVKLHGEGMVIAIIDTGIDYNHTDLSHEPDSAKLSKDSVNELIKSKNLHGEYKTAKVPYAYNYADKNMEVVDLDQNDNHGMHVAGIAGADGTDYLKDSAFAEAKAAGKSDDEAKAAAKDLKADNKTHVDGAAPQAQLLDMKVFSNSAGLTESCSTPNVIQAIEDAVKLGADVISMSLGSDNGETGTDIEDIAIGKAADEGVISVVAAGNAGNHNSPGATSQYIKGHGRGTTASTQTVGAPSVNPYALSVAASQNTGVALQGLNIYDKDHKKLKLFDSVEGTLVGPYSKGLYYWTGQPKEFPDSAFDIVTLKDNHKDYLNDVRKDMDSSVLELLKKDGIELYRGFKYKAETLYNSPASHLALNDSEQDYPVVDMENPLDRALRERDLAARNNGGEGEFVSAESVRVGQWDSSDHFLYNPDSLPFGQGFKTDLEGYSGNWHDPFDKKSDSSAHPGTDVNGKIVILGYEEIPFVTGLGRVNPNITLVQNLKDSGAAGIIYVAPKEWTPSNEEDYVNFERNIAKYFNDVELPAIIIPQNDGLELAKRINELNEAAQKEKKELPKYYLKKGDVGVDNSNARKMAEYSSYGPTDELELKPEITAVGSDVWSLKNNNTFQYLSGTSMATPETSGITTLLLQHLKSFTNHKTGKDLIKQSKNLLMNSATPIFESPFSSNYAHKNIDEDSISLDERDKLKWSDIDGLDRDYDHNGTRTKDSYRAQETLVSPRRQGAGEINASKALSTTTSLLDAADGDVSLALKEIGAHTNFKVILTNFGDKTKSYQLDSKYNHVYAQNEVMDADSDEGHYALYRQLDFPLKNEVASLTLSKGYDETITLEPGKSVEISGTLDINDPNFKENWVEGYVGVKEIGSNETAVIPYFGYTGKTDKNPIFDKFAYEDGTVGNKMEFISSNPNRADIEGLGLDLDANGHGYFNENGIAFGPGNGDRIFPAYTILRNTKELQFNILDSNKNLIRKLQTIAHQTPNPMREDLQHVYLDARTKWNGSKWNLGKNAYEQLPEGKYYYQFKGIGTRSGDTEQTREIPITIDNTAPEIKDVEITKEVDGTYTLRAKITENGSGFTDAFSIGIMINGENDGQGLGSNGAIIGHGFKGTKEIETKIPAGAASRLVEGKNEIYLGVVDQARNDGVFHGDVVVKNANGEPVQQGFRLVRPYYSGDEDSNFIVFDGTRDCQVDAARQLIHIKGYSSKEFYVNKQIKVSLDKDSEFDSWISYADEEVYTKIVPTEMQDGTVQDLTFESVRNLKFSYEAGGEEIFKTVEFSTDALSSDGKPIFRPDDSWGTNYLFREGGEGADNSVATHDMRLEIDSLKEDKNYQHDDIIQRVRDYLWITNSAGEIDIKPTQTLKLQDGAGEVPFARVTEQRKNDHFEIINLSTGEYNKDGKVYSKGGDLLPDQSFTPDTNNHNSITAKFSVRVGSNVVEIKDLDYPSYNSFTFVQALDENKGMIDDWFKPSRYSYNSDGAVDVGIAAVKSGDYTITDPATGDGIFHLKGHRYDDYSDLHWLIEGEKEPDNKNKVTEGERDSETGRVDWEYGLKLKNNVENDVTRTWYATDKEGMQRGLARFNVDITAPTLKLGDKFKTVPKAPAESGIPETFDNTNDLGEFTINSTNGKLNLDGVFGDNHWDFNLRVNGNMVYRSKHENQEGPWPGEEVDFKDVDFGRLLELTPIGDNYFVLEVTDGVGNVTIAHIKVTQNADPEVTPPANDSATDSQTEGETKDSTVPAYSTDSSEPQDSTKPADTTTPADTSVPANVLTADQLTDANRDGVAIDPNQTGRDIRIAIDSPSVNAGDTITAYIYSDPTLLGTYTVQEDSNGKYITVTVPDTFTGDHKIALYNAAGDLVGWAPVTLASGSVAAPSDLPTTSSTGKLPTTGIHLPATGEEAATRVVYAGLVILSVGGAFVLLRRRKISE